VAAAKNGHGVVGVAPGVKIAAIRVADDAGLFYSEAVVCAFMHAAEKRMQVRPGYRSIGSGATLHAAWNHTHVY